MSTFIESEAQKILDASAISIRNQVEVENEHSLSLLLIHEMLHDDFLKTLKPIYMKIDESMMLVDGIYYVNSTFYCANLAVTIERVNDYNYPIKSVNVDYDYPTEEIARLTERYYGLHLYIKHKLQLSMFSLLVGTLHQIQ
jgi:hypothetical protein